MSCANVVESAMEARWEPAEIGLQWYVLARIEGHGSYQVATTRSEAFARLLANEHNERLFPIDDSPTFRHPGLDALAARGFERNLKLQSVPRVRTIPADPDSWREVLGGSRA